MADELNFFKPSETLTKALNEHASQRFDANSKNCPLQWEPLNVTQAQNGIQERIWVSFGLLVYRLFAENTAAQTRISLTRNNNFIKEYGIPDTYGNKNIYDLIKDGFQFKPHSNVDDLMAKLAQEFQDWLRNLGGHASISKEGRDDFILREDGGIDMIYYPIEMPTLKPLDP